MSLSEITDTGSPHSWANYRVNNFTVDGILKAKGGVIPGPGTINIFYNQITTSDTSVHTYLTVPVTNNNCIYDVNIKAVGYTSVGNIGFGCISELDTCFSYVSGVIFSTNQVGADVNDRINYSGSVGQPYIGALCVSSGLNILCEIQNGFSGDTTDWMITTIVTGPIN
jgi:hypothetical protein